MTTDDQHIVSAGTRRFRFEWFSSLPSYRSANRAQLEDFLRDVRLPTPWVGIDIACGVGLMSDLCQEVASRIGARLLGTVMIDRDLNALEIAREHLARSPIVLLQSLGQSLPLPDDLGSYVVIGNGIHNFGADENRPCSRRRSGSSAMERGSSSIARSTTARSSREPNGSVWKPSGVRSGLPET